MGSAATDPAGIFLVDADPMKAASIMGDQLVSLPAERLVDQWCSQVDLMKIGQHCMHFQRRPDEIRSKVKIMIRFKVDELFGLYRIDQSLEDVEIAAMLTIAKLIEQIYFMLAAKPW